MADYDKDMAEERIQISDDENKIFEDDKKKREAAGSSSRMLASNSPAKNQNKGYADSRELTDMPLTKDMTGGRHGSWMSKHATQRFSSPLKEQGYNARLDDALGAKHGHSVHQSLTDRRDESEAMERHLGHHKFSGDKNMS
tara:strand:- start:4279 stop:4701 length:423 start_codon:yes stop_codon:yes gene_type:complete